MILPRLVEERPDSFADLFVGGGSVTLAVAESLPGATLFVNDLHPDVAAFWSVVSGDQDRVNALCDTIVAACPTVERFRVVRESTPTTDLERAFKVLFLNRCSFSGIGVNPIGGWRQTSRYTVDCRWNRERTVSQIRACWSLLRGRTTVTSVDATDAPWADRVYLDPPYYKAGATLYHEGMDDYALHERLASYLRPRTGWVLSYDEHPVVRSLYWWATVEEVPVRYSIRTPGASAEGADRPEDYYRDHELLVTP